MVGRPDDRRCPRAGRGGARRVCWQL